MPLDTNKPDSKLNYHLFTFTFNKDDIELNDNLKQRLYVLLFLFSDIDPVALTNQPMDYDLLDAIIDQSTDIGLESLLLSDLQNKIALIYKSTEYIRKSQMNESSIKQPKHVSSVISIHSITSCSILTCNYLYIVAIQQMISDLFTNEDYITVQESIYSHITVSKALAFE